MNTAGVTLYQERSMLVAPGQLVRSAYVDVFACLLACRDRMSVGDVDRAYQKLLQCGENSPWPCPRGHWAGERFVIVDGRHEYVAALMLGRTNLLVAWAEPAQQADTDPGCPTWLVQAAEKRG